MAQKLWEKSVQVNKDIERFTVGRDREMDLYLAKHDVGFHGTYHDAGKYRFADKRRIVPAACGVEEYLRNC